MSDLIEYLPGEDAIAFAVGDGDDRTRVLNIDSSGNVRVGSVGIWGPDPTYDDGYAEGEDDAMNPELWDGLAGAWIPSLGPTESTLLDISGNENNGTLVGMDPLTDWVLDANGYLLDFDGNDSVRIGIIPGLQILGDISISAWIKIGQTEKLQTIIATGQINDAEADNFLWHLGIDISNHLRFFWEYGSGVNVLVTCSVVTGFSVGETHHVAAIRSNDGTTVKFFIDGSQVGNTVTGLTKATGGSTSGVAIGCAGDFTAEYLHGGVFSVIVYDRAISDTEMLLLYEDPMALVRLSGYTLAGDPSDYISQSGDNLDFSADLENVIMRITKEAAVAGIRSGTMHVLDTLEV